MKRQPPACADDGPDDPGKEIGAPDDRRPCRICGYDLRGLTSERCPECGATIIAPPERRALLGWVALSAFWAAFAIAVVWGLDAVRVEIIRARMRADVAIVGFYQTELQAVVVCAALTFVPGLMHHDRSRMRRACEYLVMLTLVIALFDAEHVHSVLDGYDRMRFLMRSAFR